MFAVFPMLFSLVLSFMNWNGIGDMQFAGFANYVRLWTTDTLFQQSLKNTAFLILFIVPFQVGMGLMMAVLIKDVFRRISRGLQLFHFLPYVTTSVAVALLFRLLFDFQFGSINFILAELGIIREHINWFGTVSGARSVVIILASWKIYGYNMILFLAGLSVIPSQLYEAATIDGAGAIQKFFRITLPMLRPVMTFVVVMGIINGFQLFDLPQIMFPLGGPSRRVLTAVMNMYSFTFESFNLGYGSAIAYSLFIVILVVSNILLRFFNRNED